MFMKILDWLEQGDWVIKYLVLKYLKNYPMENEDKGYIERYLGLFDKETGLWGGSLYSNKWISSTYTLLELNTWKFHGITLYSKWEFRRFWMECGKTEEGYLREECRICA